MTLMVEHVQRELVSGSYTAVIFQLLDNNLYFASTEDGRLIPASRDNDGLYHIEDDLTIADKTALLAVMKLCGPLWEVATGRHMVVISPLPRYVKEGCCGEPEHMPNRREIDFYQKQKQELAACSKSMKDFLFNAGLRNGRVMDPMRNLRGMSADEIWGRDPVHPKDEIYALLADGVLDVEKTCGNKQEKRKMQDRDWDSGSGDRVERTVRGRREDRGPGGQHDSAASRYSRPAGGTGEGRGGGGRWASRGGRGWGGGERGGRCERGGRGSRGGRYSHRGTVEPSRH